MRLLTLEDVRAACIGGGVLAAGGGGWLEHGLRNGETAVRLGRPMLADISEIPADGVIVTVTAIGAPAAPNWQMYPRDYIRALELLVKELGTPIAGVMTAQNGYSTSINGWLQSAMLGIPVIDAAGDVRAHPTGNMGSMGLTSLPGYATIQVVAGGNRDMGAYLEVVARGDVTRTSHVLRAASIQSGGFIASARNPIAASYVRQHAALGAISIAIDLGKAMIAAEPAGGAAVIAAVAASLRGQILGTGPVHVARLETLGSYDRARFIVRSDRGPLTVHVLNEHMAVDGPDGERLSTFPDVIALLDAHTGQPVPAGKTVEGMELAVLIVDRSVIPLASGVTDPAVYPEVEAEMGIELARYLGTFARNSPHLQDTGPAV
jgi:uncharacterized protein